MKYIVYDSRDIEMGARVAEFKYAHDALYFMSKIKHLNLGYYLWDTVDKEWYGC